MRAAAEALNPPLDTTMLVRTHNFGSDETSGYPPSDEANAHFRQSEWLC
jgi:hypothetical protein